MKRNYVFTSFHEAEPSFNEKVDYLIYGAELCPETRKKHWQGYVEFSSGVSIKTAQRRLNCEGSHFEGRLGSQADAIKYCMKDGDYKEFGQKKAQGARTDLATLKDDMLAGKTVDQITMEQPDMYHQYGRTLTKIEDIILRQKFRTEMTQGEWVYGKTGVGKSHYAFEGFDPKTHYVWKEDNGWQDGYTGQKIVIINEFRGGIPYSELLALLDKWPHYLKRRNREPVPFLAEKVIITSSLSPEECYHNLAERDSLEQLHRRCTVREIGHKCSGVILDPEPWDGSPIML